jgi:hypothetical protein
MSYCTSAESTWNLKRCWVVPGWNLHCSHLHVAVSIGIHPNEVYREEGSPGPGWNPQSSQGSPNGVPTAAIYTRLFPWGCLWMESAEKMGYPEWNQDLNQELLPLMDGASAIDVVKIHCTMIDDHFKNIIQCHFNDPTLKYNFILNPIFLPVFISCWDYSKYCLIIIPYMHDRFFS